jgi:cellulose synthase/poly-beta-1,6-N-acetylglucosamine synthase-like glycosyltransferase
MNDDARTATVPVSVVVPAHDEAAVIGRCLTTLLRGAEPGEIELIVVCNGCTDDTASEARAHAPDATVLELPVASKPAALNAGDQCATRFPRFYLDADVELPITALRALARPLAGHRAAYAAPAARFVLRQRSASVRAYLGVWRFVAEARDEPSGGGVFGLSAGGRTRFRAFPDLIADDQFVVQQFHPSERQTVDDVYATVHPPMTLGALLRTRTRVYRGNEQLARSGLARYPAAGGAVTALRKLARRPRHLPAVTVYVAVNLLARALARMPDDGAWARDDGSRVAATHALRSA